MYHKMYHIWIVEMLIDNSWEPTVGAAITITEARDKCRHWHLMNPEDKFRIRKYIRAY